MSMQILIPVAIVLSIVGLFTVAWLRYSRPVHLVHGKTRVAPRL